jgi:hypothetical protein
MDTVIWHVEHLFSAERARARDLHAIAQWALPPVMKYVLQVVQLLETKLDQTISFTQPLLLLWQLLSPSDGLKK